jgi:hypothetical protein
MRPGLSVHAADRERYPRSTTPQRAEIVATARRELADVGAAAFPEFIAPDALKQMQREAMHGLPRAYRRDQQLGFNAKGLLAEQPSDALLAWRSPYKMWGLGADVLPADGAVHGIYGAPALIDLVRDILGLKGLYRVADSLVSVNVTYMSEGDQHGWHFDDNDFVVSLLLQMPERGGAFEFVPRFTSASAPEALEVLRGRRQNAHARGRAWNTAAVPGPRGVASRQSGRGPDAEDHGAAELSHRARLRVSEIGAPEQPGTRRMNSSISLRMALAAALTAPTVLVSSAFASPNIALAATVNDASGAALEEVIVTAQRRSERIQDVPSAITALDGDAISRLNLRGTEELARQVPSMTFDVLTPGESTITMRGLGTAYGLSPTVSYYLNEVPLDMRTDGYSGAPDIDLFDVDRIEVLRGPQGTLYGAR